jgi:hypothetical protein
MLDCKGFYFRIRDGKLIAAAPFLARLSKSQEFDHFPSAESLAHGILSVFRCVYNVEGLKMNIKFEVEVLCKNLGIKLEDIKLRNELLACRVAPVKERNPDFNIKSSAAQVCIYRAAFGPLVGTQTRNRWLYLQHPVRQQMRLDMKCLGWTGTAGYSDSNLAATLLSIQVCNSYCRNGFGSVDDCVAEAVGTHSC